MSQIEDQFTTRFHLLVSDISSTKEMNNDEKLSVTLYFAAEILGKLYCVSEDAFEAAVDQIRAFCLDLKENRKAHLN